MHLRVGFLALIASSSLLAQVAKEIPSAEIMTKAREVRDLVSDGIPVEYVVEGRKEFNSWALTAKRIIFKPGATLIFSEEAVSRRNEFFIVAEEIVSEDQANPGKITWANSGSGSSAPPAAGEAPGGYNGSEDGDAGGPGANGATGNQGYPGRDAPSLTIFVRKAVGSGQLLEFVGQNGSLGGTGQKGGAGGVGHKGSPASQNMINCNRGAGYGGAGGSGGAGGTGGTGGSGGVGGTITLVSLSDNLSILGRLYRVDVSGGKGGSGGTGGPGGAGGPGGDPGEKSLPYCKDEPERRGGGGANGNPGTIGTKGSDGNAGDFLVTGLTAEHFDKILNGGGN